MATEDIDRLCYNVLDCSITGKLEPPLARLGNCLAANHNAKLVYCLGDNNVVMVLQVSQDATVPVIQGQYEFDMVYILVIGRRFESFTTCY